MNRTASQWSAVFLACLMLSACQGQGASAPIERMLDVQQLHTGASCGKDSASVTAVANAKELNAIIADRSRIDAKTKTIDVDFNTRTVLNLSMGQQPSLGYRFELKSATVNSHTRQLTIHTTWQGPEPGKMQAAVILEPCVVLSVPRNAYTIVQVLDQSQQEKLLIRWPSER